MRKLDDYVDTVKDERPRHRNLIESIEQIRKATARLLWTDPPECFPDDGAPVWWEVWLRKNSDIEDIELEHLLRVVRLQGLSCPPEQSLKFGDRTVCLLQGTVKDIVQVVERVDGIAELRRSHQPEFFTNMDRPEQVKWIEDLLSHAGSISGDAPAPSASWIPEFSMSIAYSLMVSMTPTVIVLMRNGDLIRFILTVRKWPD